MFAIIAAQGGVHLVEWRRPARLALIWAGLGVVILISGLLLDRFTDTYPWVIWVMLGIGVAGIVVGAIILLNAVAPRRQLTRMPGIKKAKSK
jgi:Na+/phosphate symporter